MGNNTHSGSSSESEAVGIGTSNRFMPSVLVLSDAGGFLGLGWAWGFGFESWLFLLFNLQSRIYPPDSAVPSRLYVTPILCTHWRHCCQF